MNQKSTKRFGLPLHAYFFLALAIVLGLNTNTTFAQSGNCACTNSNSNLLTTGSFEAGTNNFNSITKTDLGLVLPRNGSYEIVSNAIYGSGGGYLNIAPHSGSKLMLIHTSANAGDRLWATTIAVVPGHTYQFCAWIANAKINPTTGFTITLNANKTVIATGTAVYGWTKLCGSYTVPAGTTSVEFSIKDPNPGFGPSHFLALDDICVTGDNRIGDFVWNDVNANGSQDAGEGGIPNVTVSLYTCLNVLVGTTTTNAGGIYSFTNFNPGSYYVVFTLPSGYNFSPANQGGDITKDSDPNAVTGKSGCVTLTSGQANITVDAGLYRKASLGDLVWNDANANGKQDAGETGIANVTVKLFTCANLQVSATTTNSGGIYAFNNLTPGSYYVMFTLPSGYGYSPANQGADITKDSDPNPANGKSGCVSLSSGQVNTTLDAGLFRTTSLGDLVWNDANANGIQDAGETGKANVTVKLYTCANVLAGTTTTNSNGIYAFTNLPPGSFYVIFILPSGYSFSAANAGGNITKDSDPNPASGKSGCVTLIAGQANSTVDAGLYQKASLGDFVWHDLDANGLQDETEPGRKGIIVTLTYPNGTTVSAVTGVDGKYLFSNLEPGQYVVAFSTPDHFFLTFPNVGSDDTKDSDPVNGTVEVTLGAGENNNTIDAGVYCDFLSVGNYVWYDQNNDGIQDPSETGIGGATVKLYRDANSDNLPDGTVVATTTTNPDGLYSFPSIMPGKYIVGVTIPAGYAAGATTATSATPDNDDNTDNNGVTIVDGELRSNFITLITTFEPTNDGDPFNGNTTLDFGFTGSGSIGDFVFHDLDANGIQDIVDPGKKGVIVTLTYPNGATISAVTLVDGKYLFSNLAPGDYVITFTAPDHFFFTLPNEGSDDTKDSDPVNGTVSVTLGAGENNKTIDAGVYCDFLSVGNYVWYDQNNDGIQDPSETGIGGATVKLYRDANSDNLPDGTVVATTTTNPDGLYSFPSIMPGKYIVGVTIPAGYAAGATTATSATPDNDDNTDNNGVTIVDGELRSNFITLITTFEPTNDGDPFNGNTTLDFGFTGSGSIGDFVFHDLDANGIQDIVDPGKKGVIVTLTYPNGATASAVTQVDGKYLFSKLAPGQYMVAFLAPDHFFLTLPNVGSNDAKDSDPVNGTVDVTLGAGENNKTIDAGTYCDFLSVGNFVWNDENNNGIQDPSETGISGASVKLYIDANADNVPDGTAVATTLTKANGLYSFPSIFPGKFIVGVIIPSGYSAGATTATSASPDNDDNTDNNGVTTVSGELRSNFISLITTYEPTNDGDPFNGNTTLDFGLYPTPISAARSMNSIDGGQAIKNVFKGFQILGVYPNPFADKIIIGYTSEKAQKVTIRILDNAGKMVYTTQSMVLAGKNNIQLSSLSRYSAGGYMVELRTSNEVYTKQIMK